MLGTATIRAVGLTLAAVLAITLGPARPAQAKSDLPKILAAATVGYLVYKALDAFDNQYTGYRHHYHPPERHRDIREWYDRGYRDGWADAVRYQRERHRNALEWYISGYRDGWADAVGYRSKNHRDQGRHLGWEKGQHRGWEGGLPYGWDQKGRDQNQRDSWDRRGREGRDQTQRDGRHQGDRDGRNWDERDAGGQHRTGDAPNGKRRAK